MTMVRPVLRDDPFAGVGWSTSLALLALKKFSVGEILRDDERQSISDTTVFVASLLSPPPDIFSREKHRAMLFWAKATQGLQLEQLARDLESVSRLLDSPVTFDAELVDLLDRTQVGVCDILEVVNICRS